MKCMFIKSGINEISENISISYYVLMDIWWKQDFNLIRKVFRKQKCAFFKYLCSSNYQTCVRMFVYGCVCMGLSSNMDVYFLVGKSVSKYFYFYFMQFRIYIALNFTFAIMRFDVQNLPSGSACSTPMKFDCVYNAKCFDICQ